MLLVCSLFPLASIADLFGGTTPKIAAPVNVFGGDNDNDRRIFTEQLRVGLTVDLTVDHLVSGLSFPNIELQNIEFPDGFSSGEIPAGTIINSYYFYIDPVENSFGPGNWTALFQSTEFDRSSLLGFIFLSSTLDESDFLSNPTTSYPRGTATRGLEVGDRVTATLIAPGISAVEFILDGSDPYDAVRVIELAQPIPIPVSLLLMASCLPIIGHRVRSLLTCG